jgi:hypothetical protein
MKHLILIATVSAALLASPATSDTIYVDGVNGNDEWDGLCEVWDGETCGPKKTIQAGVDAAENADEVILADAVYSGPGNIGIPFAGKAITVRSRNGPKNCIVDAQFTNTPAFGFYENEAHSSILEGLTITHCDQCCGHAAIQSDTNCTIINCVLIDNTGGGIATSDSMHIIGCRFENNGDGGILAGDEPVIVNCTFVNHPTAGIVGKIWSNPQITNCLFINNYRGLYLDYSMPSLTNCSFVSNYAASGRSLYGTDGSQVAMHNCILWNGGNEVLNDGTSTIVIRYSCVDGGYGGTGNIDADPLFADPDGPDNIPGTEDDDLRLRYGSPCIDAGDNTTVLRDYTDLDDDGDTQEPVPLDMDGNERFFDDPDTEDTGNGAPPIIDMGAYEYQPPECPADFDGDGDVDTADLLYLLAAWGTPDGDVDGDGDTDTADLLALLAAWGECP